MPVTYGFPDRYYTKLKYIETYPDENATALPVQRIWKLNSCYDPNHTGTGHQPTYFDQLSERYRHYRVLGAHVKLVVTNLNPTYPLDLAHIATTLNSVSFDPESVAQNKNGSPVFTVSSEGSNNTMTIGKYFDVAQLSGVTKRAVKDDSVFRGLTGNFGTGSDPNHKLYFYLNGDSPSNNVVSWITRMELTQYVVFEDPKPVLES